MSTPRATTNYTTKFYSNHFSSYGCFFYRKHPYNVSCHHSMLECILEVNKIISCVNIPPGILTTNLKVDYDKTDQGAQRTESPLKTSGQRRMSTIKSVRLAIKVSTMDCGLLSLLLSVSISVVHGFAVLFYKQLVKSTFGLFKSTDSYIRHLPKTIICDT